MCAFHTGGQQEEKHKHTDSTVTYRSQPKQPNGGARAPSTVCRLEFYGVATGSVQLGRGLVSVNAVLQTTARAHPNDVKADPQTASRPFSRRRAYCWRPCSKEPSALVGEVESGAGSVGAPPQPAATMRQKRPQQLVNRSRGEGLEMSRARQSVPSQPSIRKGALPSPVAQTLPARNQGENNKCDSFDPLTACCA